MTSLFVWCAFPAILGLEHWEEQWNVTLLGILVLYKKYMHLFYSLSHAIQCRSFITRIIYIGVKYLHHTQWNSLIAVTRAYLLGANHLKKPVEYNWVRSDQET